MKKQFRLLPALLALLMLAACGVKTPTYRTDAEAQSILEECSSSLPAFSDLAAADEDYVKYRMAIDISAADSHTVYIQNKGTALDEVGIFRSASEDSGALKALIETYLKNRNDEWTGLYLVEEYPKLKDAEVRVFGKYVVYAILSDSDKAAFFHAVDTYLQN